jgi:hypothetical protein
MAVAFEAFGSGTVSLATTISFSITLGGASTTRAVIVGLSTGGFRVAGESYQSNGRADCNLKLDYLSRCCSRCHFGHGR